jgi:hypothetical protein
VDDLLIPGRHFYGLHTIELVVRPATDGTAGVLIDLVRFDFDDSQRGKRPAGTGRPDPSALEWHMNPAGR